MYSALLLRTALWNLYDEHREDYSEDEMEEMLDSLDLESLLQAVRDRAQTVYAYATQGKRKKSFNYRSRELFGQRAALLYEDFDRSTAEEAVVTSRTYELWLLEDMSLATVACVSVSFDGGAYETAYREVKEDDPGATGMFLDIAELTGVLEEMCCPVYEGEQPLYEL